MQAVYSKDIGAKVVLEAAKFLGLTEIRSNAEWDDLSTSMKDTIAEEFKGELLRTGWQTGWPYCAAFCEVVWRRAYAGRPELPDIKEMLTPGCMLTYERAVNLGFVSKTPVVGAIGIMKRGTGPQGHAFIVAGISGTKLTTIEANTSPVPGTVSADREGDGVYKKTRLLEFKPTTGLHLIGFIQPCIYA